jgi:lipopolysaccharide biosynthesis glycosyltransferase
MNQDRFIHIALAFDDNFWAPAYAVMRSVCLATKRRADLVFHLCHDGLSSERRTEIEAITTEFGAQLRDYPLQQHETFNIVARTLPIPKRLHSVIYARMLLDLLLPHEVNRVIYLDCDTMVVAPIEQLWDSDFGGNAIAAVPDGWGKLCMGGRDMRKKTRFFRPRPTLFQFRCSVDRPGALRRGQYPWQNRKDGGRWDSQPTLL